MDDLERRAAETARALQNAQSILFLTGAGISVASGLPTYRGIGGLYADVGTEDGVPIEEALSGSMMRTRPALTWKYIGQIERACRGARHNRGHELIAELCRRSNRGVVLTQNVDGFHLDAGTEDVIEIHGSIRRLRCTECDHVREVRSYAGLELPPACPECGALERPDVVLFGELLPDPVVHRLQRELARGFGAVVSIGTSAVFPYIAEPVVRAARAGLPTVEIDPGTTILSGIVTHRLKAPATEALEAIVAAW